MTVYELTNILSWLAPGREIKIVSHSGIYNLGDVVTSHVNDGVLLIMDM